MQAVFCTDHSHLFPGGHIRTENKAMTDEPIAIADLSLLRRAEKVSLSTERDVLSGLSDHGI
jgi:hypothetical protein